VKGVVMKAMPAWFIQSSFAKTYFRSSAEGKVFRSPSPWLFGRPREYMVGDSQSEILVERIARAKLVSMSVVVLALILLVPGVLIFFDGPLQNLEQHPIAASAIIVAFTLVLAAISVAIELKAINSILAGRPWTPGERDPYMGKVYRSKFAAPLLLLPTWLLVTMAILSLIAIPKFVVEIYEGAASGRVSWGLVGDVVMLEMCLFPLYTLVKKFRMTKSRP
jgi:hypothetical protein